MPSISAIILVGGPGTPPLRSAIDAPVCLLPIPNHPTLLGAWIEMLSAIDVVSDIRIVTGRASDHDAIDRVLSHRESAFQKPVSLRVDLHEHRGTAGTIRDIVIADSITQDVLFIEGTVLPPSTLQPLLDVLPDGTNGIVGRIGRSAEGEPAGAIYLCQQALECVPPIGFVDVKEQLLTRLIEQGATIEVREISGRTFRLNTVERYLQAIKYYGTRVTPNNPAGPWIDASAHVDETAIIGANVLIAADVQVGPGCVVQDSALLRGTQVGAGALVARSIVRHNEQVPPNAMHIDCQLSSNPVAQRLRRGAKAPERQRTTPGVSS